MKKSHRIEAKPAIRVTLTHFKCFIVKNNLFHLHVHVTLHLTTGNSAHNKNTNVDRMTRSEIHGEALNIAPLLILQ